MLEVVSAVIGAPPTSFTFLVPGSQRWTVRTVCAVAATAAGGTPNRAYLLSITDGTSLVAQAGAADVDTDPATVTITWCNAAQGVVNAGGVGCSVAPLANFILNPGYVVRGSITNPAVGDAWTSAVIWVDYVPTG